MDATPVTNTPPPLDEMFALTVRLVTSAIREGLSPTAAGLKSEMVRMAPDFSEKNYNFSKFLAYLEAAETSGLLTVHRDTAGHPRLGLPGLALPYDARKDTEAHRRLRPDLWSAIVNWDEPFARYWDRKRHCAISLPLSDDGAPLWESDDRRFSKITPVTMAEHLKWMREFAENLPDGKAREGLVEALSEDAAGGAFKRLLHANSLTSEWGASLRSSVLAHARNWANENGVPARTFLEPGRRDTGVRPRAQESSNAGESTLAYEAEPTRSAPKRHMSDTDRLRLRLHTVIDSMSTAELATLSIPAGYLIAE